MCVYVLSASGFHGAVIDLASVVLELGRRVYRASDAMICVLSEDNNGVTKVCGDLGCCINDLERIELMVVDTSDINLSLMF